MFVVVALAVQYSTHAQQQRPGGPPAGAPSERMMMMKALHNVEGTWAYVSFVLDVPDDMLLKLRKAFQEAWTKNAELRKKLEEARGDTNAMRTIRTEADKIKSELDKKLKDTLTPEQMTKLTNWEKEQRTRMQQRFQRPQGAQPPRPQSR